MILEDPFYFVILLTNDLNEHQFNTLFDAFLFFKMEIYTYIYLNECQLLKACILKCL